MKNLVRLGRSTLEATAATPTQRRRMPLTEREYIARQRREAAKRVTLARKVARAQKGANV